MKNFYEKSFKVGILGGGQLGRMLLQESPNLNIDLYTMDSNKDSPCAKISKQFVLGDILNYDDVMKFGSAMDVVSIEIENVNIEALEELERKGVKVFPQPNVIKIIKDKGIQKQFYIDNQIPTAEFYLTNTVEDVKQRENFLPFAHKLRTGGYDGKGVNIIRKASEIEQSFTEPSLVETLIDLDKELAVIVAKNEAGECKCFPVVEQAFNPKANLVEFLFSPAEITEAQSNYVQELATKIIQKLDMVGILAVEFFLDKSGEILVNEIAPRPHNSGHQTIEGNYTSQFGQHLRSILNLPLGDTKPKGNSVMINILGAENHYGKAVYSGLEEVLKIDGAYPHIYGKDETKPFRKMGHLTVVDNDMETAKTKAQSAQKKLNVISKV